MAVAAGGVDTGAATRDEHRRDGEAGIGVSDDAIGSRRREHPCSDNKRGRNGCFDGSGRREMRVIGGGEGTQGSRRMMVGRREQDEEGRGKRLPWTRIVRSRMATSPAGRNSG